MKSFRSTCFGIIVWAGWCGLTCSQFQTLLLLIAAVFAVRWLLKWLDTGRG